MNKMKNRFGRILKKTGSGAMAAAVAVSLFGSMGSSFAYAGTDGNTGEGTEQISELSDAAVFEEDSLTTELAEEDLIDAAVPDGYKTEEADDSATNLLSLAGVLQTLSEDDEEEEGSISWSLSDTGVLTITGTGSMTDYTTSNYPEWYSSASEITSVVVGEGITDLGNLSFYKLSNLTTVSLPDSLQTMGRNTFANCTSLTTVDIPSSVTELEYGVFAECTSLTEVSLDSIETIGDYVFQGTTVSEMVIPASVSSISALAFFDSEIESFSVSEGNTVYSAKDGVLYADGGTTLFAYPQANSAESFAVPDGVVTIGRTAFAYAKYLKTIEFSSSVASFGSSAFQNMYKLTAVVIPDSVTEVGMYTFYSCPKLKSVKFGSGLTVTSYQMFRNCTALTDIDFGDTLDTLYA